MTWTGSGTRGKCVERRDREDKLGQKPKKQINKRMSKTNNSDTAKRDKKKKSIRVAKRT